MHHSRAKALANNIRLLVHVNNILLRAKRTPAKTPSAQRKINLLCLETGKVRRNTYAAFRLLGVSPKQADAQVKFFLEAQRRCDGLVREVEKKLRPWNRSTREAIRVVKALQKIIPPQPGPQPTTSSRGWPSLSCPPRCHAGKPLSCCLHELPPLCQP